jgi:hypothetical protein
MASLYDYGFPSDRTLIQQALGLARAGVPSAKGIRREYGRAIGDVSGFTKALMSMLGQTDIGGAYDKPMAQEQSARAAAATRLGALGPEYADADIAAGAAGESGLSLLRANQGAASAYGRKQPGIAGAGGALGILGLVNARTDALSKRREDIGSNFAARLADVRNQALQIASTNADIDFKQQGLNLDALAAAAQMGGDTATAKKDKQAAIDKAFDKAAERAVDMFEKTGKVPVLVDGVPTGKYTEGGQRVHIRKAYQRTYRLLEAKLRPLGLKGPRIRKYALKALAAAGYNIDILTKNLTGAVEPNAPGQQGGLQGPTQPGGSL